MNFQDTEGNTIPFLKGMAIFYSSDNPSLLMVRMPRDSYRSGDTIYFNDGATVDNKLLFSHPLTHTSLMSIARLVASCVGCEIKYFKYRTGLHDQLEVQGYEFI